MTQTPYGGQQYASTGTPYATPSLEQPTDDHQPTEQYRPARHTLPSDSDGFSEPVITEAGSYAGASAPSTTSPAIQAPAASGSPSAGLPPAVSAGRYRGRADVRVRGPRRARLQVRHVNPWTVLKFSCVLSIALFFVWLITIGVLFGILEGAGIIHKINDAVTTINGTGSQDPVTAGIVFGGAAIVGVVNIILFIALSTVGSVVYNLCADLVGGVEVTLSEREP